MSYTLIIGSKNYSSWSMRAWLALRLIDVPFKEVMIPIYTEGARDRVRGLGGETGLVPALIDGETTIWDTLAIFEYLAEDHAGLWPRDRLDRARARSWAGEIHSAFGALREAMPCNTRARNRSADITAAVAGDIERTIAIWNTAGQRGSPWLFEDWSAADIMFAPIATRFRTYGVGLSGRAADYAGALLAHPDVAEWLAAGEIEDTIIPGAESGFVEASGPHGEG